MKKFLAKSSIRLAQFAQPVFARNRTAAVFATEAFGSIGDQAMLDSAVGYLRDQLGYSVSVVNDDYCKPTPLRGEYRDIPLSSSPNRRDLEFARILAGTRVFAVVGADIIDGSYYPERPIQLLTLLEYAARSGAKALVFGSSFSENYSRIVADKMAGMRDVSILIRDPISAERFKNATGRAAKLVADLAFLLRPEARSNTALKAIEWCKERQRQGDVLLGVNASGRTLNSISNRGVDAYTSVLRSWLREDFKRALILLPHDVRPAPAGDIAAMEEIKCGVRSFGDNRVHLLEEPFDAWDVKAIAGHLDLAISGRMHVAIAAMGMGVPTICIVYQGKFEGLMQYFELHGLTLSPEQFLNVEDTSALLDSVTQRRIELKIQIASKLEQVNALSKANFAGL